jgi:hypothetical protein
VKTTTEAQTAPGMPQRAAHGAEARCMIAGAEAAVWTERMLSALVNGVKGGKKKASASVGCGPMPTSQSTGCSHFTKPGPLRDSLDEETTDWRAVCGKTARTVRRAGWRKPSRPLSDLPRLQIGAIRLRLLRPTALFRLHSLAVRLLIAALALTYHRREARARVRV